MCSSELCAANAIPLENVVKLSLVTTKSPFLELHIIRILLLAESARKEQ